MLLVSDSLIFLLQARQGLGTEIYETKQKYRRTQSHLITLHSIITIRAVQEKFKSAKLNLRCLATMFTLYKRTEEVEVQEDAPQLAPIMVPTTQSSKGRST